MAVITGPVDEPRMIKTLSLRSPASIRMPFIADTETAARVVLMSGRVTCLDDLSQMVGCGEVAKFHG
jgi:hypothetical protein